MKESVLLQIQNFVYESYADLFFCDSEIAEKTLIYGIFYPLTFEDSINFIVPTTAKQVTVSGAYKHIVRIVSILVYHRNWRSSSLDISSEDQPYVPSSPT